MKDTTGRKFPVGSQKACCHSKMIPDRDLEGSGRVEYHMRRMIHWDQERKLALSLGQVKYAGVCLNMYNAHKERARKMI